MKWVWVKYQNFGWIRLQKIRNWLSGIIGLKSYTVDKDHVVMHFDTTTLDVPLPNTEERRIHVDTWEDRGARL